jgi:zinc protease
VAALDREGLLAFRDRIYTAGNGVLAIFGAVPAAEAAELAEKHLGPLPPGERLIPPELSASPPAAREEEGVKQGAEQEAVLLGFPGPEISHPDRYPLEILAEYFSGLNSPLFLKIRAREGLVYSVGAFQVLGLLPGGFVFYAETAPGEGRKVAELIREEIRRFQEEGIGAGELGVLQNKLIGQHLFAQEENDALAFTASLDELYGLGSGSYREYPDRIREVTPEKLKEVAKKYLLAEDYALVTVGPREPGEGKD